MPIRINEIKVGDYYLTDTNQLKVVTKITKDIKGRDCVHYSAKCATMADAPFQQLHYTARPPLIETFAKGVCRHLCSDEVQALKNKKIIPSKGR